MYVHQKIFAMLLRFDFGGVLFSESNDGVPISAKQFPELEFSNELFLLLLSLSFSQ